MQIYKDKILLICFDETLSFVNAATTVVGVSSKRAWNAEICAYSSWQCAHEALEKYSTPTLTHAFINDKTVVWLVTTIKPFFTTYSGTHGYTNSQSHLLLSKGGLVTIQRICAEEPRYTIPPYLTVPVNPGCSSVGSTSKALSWMFELYKVAAAPSEPDACPKLTLNAYIWLSRQGTVTLQANMYESRSLMHTELLPKQSNMIWHTCLDCFLKSWQNAFVDPEVWGSPWYALPSEARANLSETYGRQCGTTHHCMYVPNNMSCILVS